MLDNENLFIDVNATLSGGETPLHLTCANGRWSAEVFDILLSRGAQIGDTDHLGRSCLHICIDSEWVSNDDWSWYKHHRGSPSPVARFVGGMIFLIRNGVDVRATDKYDTSVSDLAYRPSWNWYKPEYPRIGSVRGDVWDFCLASCGYDIAEFRQGRPRRVHYGAYYSREDFEELWAGKEHLCPYFNDPEVPEEDPPPGWWEDESLTDESDDEECESYKHEEESQRGNDITVQDSEDESSNGDDSREESESVDDPEEDQQGGGVRIKA